MGFSNWVNNILPGKLTTTYTNFLFKLGQSSGYQSMSDRESIEAYLTSAAWYSIVKTCAEGVASLPYEIGINKDNSFEVESSGDVHDFIFNPNSTQTFEELVELNMIYYFSNGEFFEYLDRDIPGFMDNEGRISLPPELVTVNKDKIDSILSKVVSYSFTDGGGQKTILPEDMLHVLTPNPSVQGRYDRNGLSPLQAAKNVLNASTNIETAISWYFENRGASNIVSAAAGNQGLTLRPDDQTNIEAANIQKYGGAERMNRVITSQVPVSVTQLNASSSDMQMIDNYNLIVERLCALVGLPAILVQINENSTYNNVTEAYKRAYKDVFIPNGNKLISGYKRSYLKEFSEISGKDYSMRVNVSEIEALKPTPNETREQNRLDVDSGIMTPNEARKNSPIPLEESTDPKANELHFKNETKTNEQG